MADFYQNGTITTLHNLGERSTAELEQDLLQFSERRPLGLILPSLYSEIETPALPAIIQELKSVPYLSQIVIGLDRATQDEYQHALSFFADLPQHHRVLWNDGPRLKAIDARLRHGRMLEHRLGVGIARHLIHRNAPDSAARFRAQSPDRAQAPLRGLYRCRL